jgi:hypothetical protein
MMFSCLGDSDRECPKCAPEQQMIYEIRRSQEASATDHDQFFRQASRELF